MAFCDYQTDIGVDLGLQGFDEELAGFPGKHETVLLAESGHGIGGCAGSRPLSGDAAEMKRLFVYPWARGTGLGRAFTLAVINEACRLGYRKLHLDTFQSKMPSAVALYRALGFREVQGPKRGRRAPDLVDMELELLAAAAADGYAQEAGSAE